MALRGGIKYASCLYIFYVVYSFLIVTVIVLIKRTNSHGRLIEPPSRASAWRYGFQTPPDYNDHELYCGGFTRQWKQNGGKCGECGDAWDIPEPRPHEHGGQWGQGVIVRSYQPSSEIVLRVELTASHMGYFEFRICPEPNAKQKCLDKNILRILSGTPIHSSLMDLNTRFYPRNGSRIYEIKALLPKILCQHCMLQWKYVAGNNWGICDDGNGAVGCGPQEEFRSCSDIEITEYPDKSKRPIRPIYWTTIRPQLDFDKTPSSEADHKTSYPIFIYITVIVLTLMFVLYLLYKYYHPKNNIMIHFSVMINPFCKKSNRKNIEISKKKIVTPYPFFNGKVENVSKNPLKISTLPPVPPPRVKKQSRLKESSDHEVI